MKAADSKALLSSFEIVLVLAKKEVLEGGLRRDPCLESVGLSPPRPDLDNSVPLLMSILSSSLTLSKAPPSSNLPKLESCKVLLESNEDLLKLDFLDDAGPDDSFRLASDPPPK